MAAKKTPNAQKAKPRSRVKASAVTQRPTYAELRQQLAESLEREDATAKELQQSREQQTASKTIAQKAYACGFEGIQVDGNDVFAVYKATLDAANKAKEGGGPTLIECDTYRVADHTTADDATRYRQKEQIEQWKARDPIARLRLFMEKKGLWSDAYQKDVDGRSKSTVDEAVKTAESAGPPDPRDLFTYTYSSLSQRQVRQLKDF